MTHGTFVGMGGFRRTSPRRARGRRIQLPSEDTLGSSHGGRRLIALFSAGFCSFGCSDDREYGQADNWGATSAPWDGGHVDTAGTDAEPVFTGSVATANGDDGGLGSSGAEGVAEPDAGLSGEVDESDVATDDHDSTTKSSTRDADGSTPHSGSTDASPGEQWSDARDAGAPLESGPHSEPRVDGGAGQSGMHSGDTSFDVFTTSAEFPTGDEATASTFGDGQTGSSTGDGVTESTAGETLVSPSSDDESPSTGEPWEPPGIVVEASAAADVVGYPTKLMATATASDDSAVSYIWSLVSKPVASQLTSADITSDQVGFAQFYPDLAGDYVVRASASSDTASGASFDVNVSVPAYDVGYLTLAGDDDAYAFAPAMIRSDGTGSRVVGCYEVITDEDPEASGLSGWLVSSLFLPILVAPYYPRDPDQPSRLAYMAHDTMYFASSTTNCGANPPPTVAGSFVRYNRDGSRASALITATPPENQPEKTRAIVTFGEDGVMTTIGLVAGDATEAAWTSNGQLLWIDPQKNADGTTSFRVRTAVDANGAADNLLLSDTVMDCAGVPDSLVTAALQHIVERNGRLFLASQTSINSAGAIWVLNPRPGGDYDCSAIAPTNRQLTTSSKMGFDVSDDGASILYGSVVPAEVEGDVSRTDLFVVATDSPGDLVLLASAPQVSNSQAHFTLGGRQVIWTSTQWQTVVDGESTTQRPVTARLMISNRDGTQIRTLTEAISSQNEARLFHTGAGGYDCSLRIGVRSPGRWAALVAVGIAFLGRLRRARRRS